MNLHFWKSLIVISILSISACASLDKPAEAHDPWERMNRSVYKFNNSVDKAILKPVAKGYKKITPNFVEKGVDNFFSNLNEIKVIVNDILQLKFLQALSDTGRFVTNSTIGIYGLFDVATHIKLQKHDEDFGQTLGYWNIPTGPYLVLPFYGPSSLRDGAGFAVDYTLLNPIEEIDDDSTRYTLYALDLINSRTQLIEAGNILEVAALDPYVFMREAYLQKRLKQVKDGETKDSDTNLEDEVDIFTDE